MTLTVQFYTMAAMIGMGSFLGASLDTYNLFLRRRERKRWVVYINDFIFWLVQTFFIFYVLLLVNEGELRFYVFLALLCGFAAYQSILRKGYMKLLHILIKVTLFFIRFFNKLVMLFIITPIRGMSYFAVASFMSLFLFLWNTAKWTSQFLMKLCKILLAPLFWAIKLIVDRIPRPVRQRLFFFKRLIEGIWKYIKKIIRKLYRRFR